MASVTVTPNTINAGEQGKIEGTGFALDTPVTVTVDGDEVGTAPTRPSPEGGVADFYFTFESPGEYEVEMTDGDEKVSVDVEVVSQYPEVEAEQPPGRAKAPAKARTEEMKEDSPKRGTATPKFQKK